MKALFNDSREFIGISETIPDNINLYKDLPENFDNFKQTWRGDYDDGEIISFEELVKLPQDNIEDVYKGKKHPILKIRYAKGLGDFVACILHSKLLEKLTEFITGSKIPCETCSKRKMFLNYFFPIPFWRLFFKTEEEMLNHLRQDFQNLGVHLIIQSNEPIKKNPYTQFTPDKEPETDSKIKNGYILINSSESKQGEFLIETNIYKKL